MVLSLKCLPGFKKTNFTAQNGESENEVNQYEGALPRQAKLWSINPVQLQ